MVPHTTIARHVVSAQGKIPSSNETQPLQLLIRPTSGFADGGVGPEAEEHVPVGGSVVGEHGELVRARFRFQLASRSSSS